ncbi:hypothetical protein bcgnr5388_01710 [Bacillus cereus]
MNGTIVLKSCHTLFLIVDFSYGATCFFKFLVFSNVIGLIPFLYVANSHYSILLVSGVKSRCNKYYIL